MRPANVAEAVPQLEEMVDAGEPVFVGGPVQSTSIVMLAEFLDPSPAGLLVLGSIPLFVGLAFVLPWLGYSTWHLYTRLIDREAIPRRRRA